MYFILLIGNYFKWLFNSMFKTIVFNMININLNKFNYISEKSNLQYFYKKNKNYLSIDNLKFKETKYFNFFKIQNIKIPLSIKNPYPIFQIKKMEIDLNNFEIEENKFRKWELIDKLTHSIIEKLDELSYEITNLFIVNLQQSKIEYEDFTFQIQNLVIIKNRNKTKLFISKIHIFFEGNYISKLLKIKINYTENIKKTSIISKKIMLFITDKIFYVPFFPKIKKILNEFDNNQKSQICIFFPKINIQIHLTNHISINLDEFIYENDIIDFNLKVKVSKKDVFWGSNLKLILLENKLNINCLRLRIFKSTGYKIKTVLKKLLRIFRNDKKKNVLISRIKTLKINYNYLENEEKELVDDFNSRKNYIKNCSDERNLDLSYISKKNKNEILNIININEYRIKFEKIDTNLNLKKIKIIQTEINSKIDFEKIQFFKDNLRLCETIESKDLFTIILSNNNLVINPKKIYLNLNTQIFDETFTLLGHFIHNISNSFQINSPNQNNYIFETFKINSFKALFSYDNKNVNYLNLVKGKYLELINILDLTNINLLFSDIYMTYPKTGKHLLQFIINSIFQDILKKNFKNVIKNTSLNSSYLVKKQIDNLPKYANKIYKMANTLVKKI